MRSISINVLVALLFGALACSAAWGQSTAQISGAVKDQTGAVLPGVEVTTTQTETGLKRSTVTNETGSYVLTNLPIGPYRLEASLPGFRTYAQTGIVLQVNSSPAVNPVLEVGQVSERAGEKMGPPNGLGGDGDEARRHGCDPSLEWPRGSIELNGQW